MKNYNYNLVKLLHSALDTVWRIENHYDGDSADLPCECNDILKKIKEDNEMHIKMLLEEIKKHEINE